MQQPNDPVAAVTHADPYPYYAQLVAQRPLYRDEALEVWVASSAAAVGAVFASDCVRVRPPSEPVPRAIAGTPAGEIFRHMVRMNDGPGHCPMKHSLTTMIAILEPTAAQEASLRARDLAERFAPQSDPARIFEFAAHLPVYVIASLFGAQPNTFDQLAASIGEFAACIAPGSDADALARGNRAAQALFEIFRPLVAGDDALIANVVALMWQAYDASAALIGNTLVTLARQHMADTLASDMSMLAYVIDEVVRFDSPVQNTRRWMAQDAVVGGVQMRTGDMILLVIAAANRDPALNPQPDHFDLFRKDRRSFTFGEGIHACPGTTLAATVARAGVQELLRCGIDLEHLTQGLTYRASVNARIPLFKGANRG